MANILLEKRCTVYKLCQPSDWRIAIIFNENIIFNQKFISFNKKSITSNKWLLISSKSIIFKEIFWLLTFAHTFRDYEVQSEYFGAIKTLAWQHAVHNKTNLKW